jgi:hypothetical protein
VKQALLWAVVPAERRSMRPRLCAEKYASDPAGSRSGFQIQRIPDARGIRAPESCTYRFLLCLKQHLLSETGAPATLQGRIEDRHAGGQSSFHPTSRLKLRQYQDWKGQSPVVDNLRVDWPDVVEIDQRTDDSLPHMRLGRVSHGDRWLHGSPIYLIFSLPTLQRSGGLEFRSASEAAAGPSRVIFTHRDP